MKDPFKLGTVILAAGASSRMGQPKMLLRWGKTTVLGHIIEEWKGLGAEQVAIVSDPQNQSVSEELDRLKVVHRILNDKPSRGMFSSIVCAARWEYWDPGLTHWVVVLGDQPHLRRETLRELISAARRSDLILQPSLNGRARHPVVLPRLFFQALRETRAETLKQFLESHKDFVHFIESADRGLGLDLDYPEDYERAKLLNLPKQ